MTKRFILIESGKVTDSGATDRLIEQTTNQDRLVESDKATYSRANDKAIESDKATYSRSTDKAIDKVADKLDKTYSSL
jgi:ABC-type multidrug transport system ATPase subunit